MHGPFAHEFFLGAAWIDYHIARSKLFTAWGTPYVYLYCFRSLRGLISVYVMSVYVIRVYLISVYLMSVCLISGYLISVCRISVCMISLYPILVFLVSV